MCSVTVVPSCELGCSDAAWGASASPNFGFLSAYEPTKRCEHQSLFKIVIKQIKREKMFCSACQAVSMFVPMQPGVGRTRFDFCSGTHLNLQNSFENQVHKRSNNLVGAFLAVSLFAPIQPGGACGLGNVRSRSNASLKDVSKWGFGPFSETNDGLRCKRDCCRVF